MLENIYIEIEKEYSHESNVLRKFKNISNKKNKNDFKLKAEILAFQFLERNQNEGNIYFHSFTELKENQLNEEVIKYWEKRAEISTNPILKARYAGLVWDFSIKPTYEIAITLVNSLIKIVEKRLQKEIDLIRKIKKALSVAISINNKELINKSKEVLILLEDEIGENCKPGLWGFSFDYLIYNAKVSLLSEKEQFSIIEKLENRFVEVTLGNEVDVRASELIIKRLAPYYKKKNKLKESQRLLKIYGDLIVNRTDYSMAFQYQAAIKNLQKLYFEFGMKSESDELLKQINKTNKDVLSEMHLITTESKLSKEEIDSIVIPITTGPKKEVFHKIINYFTPKKDKVIEELKKNVKKNPFLDLFKTSIIDDTGREVANVGNLEDDLIGNIIHFISQDFGFNSFFLGRIFDRLIYELNYTIDDFVNFIKESAIIDKSRIEILRKAIQAYFEKDYIVCEYLLIPQIETAIRNLIEQNNGVILEKSSDVFQVKTLNKLLLDEIITFSLGEDIQIYLRALYTDSRGWNIRNKICHGLSQPSASNKNTSERVLHSFLILGMIQRIEKK